MHATILDYSAANAMTSHVDYPDYRVDFWEKIGTSGDGAVTASADPALR